jgi:uncharacterized paraquat-inducible protein A
VLASGSSTVLNDVLLASAVVPVLIVIALAWFFRRAAKRNDERETGKTADPTAPNV